MLLYVCIEKVRTGRGRVQRQGLSNRAGIHRSQSQWTPNPNPTLPAATGCTRCTLAAISPCFLEWTGVEGRSFFWYRKREAEAGCENEEGKEKKEDSLHADGVDLPAPRWWIRITLQRPSYRKIYSISTWFGVETAAPFSLAAIRYWWRGGAGMFAVQWTATYR